jgi:hypothetical protein
VYGTFEIVHQDRRLNAILLSTIACEFDFLLPAPMRTVMLPWVRLAYVDREKLEPLTPIASVKFV